jgi:hypothetical protein
MVPDTTDQDFEFFGPVFFKTSKLYLIGIHHAGSIVACSARQSSSFLADALRPLLQ